MKVKRLEIQGFKSFKDKTVVNFDDGVTGIVGPNGCGKSNIVDSFFWVMGEQSAKHLRGNNSSDFIFSGSQKYTPGNLAEVTMVLSTGASKDLDLSDGSTVRDLPAHMRFPEISITRRLYRSGESEYLINGQTCRLKDIHELFMDTGAGPKAYSIIEQGQISKIVASKPEDRRTLVEEAAGITKFKARKKESLRKIEATQGNLARINDIVSEIERQLNSLERQASKARQYKKYKEELQDKELFIGRKRLFSLKTRIIENTDQINSLSGAELEAKNQLVTAELRIENLKVQGSEAERSAEDVLQQLQTAQKNVGQLQTKVELQKRSIQEVHTANENLEAEKDALQVRISSSEQEVLSLQKDAEECKARFENADGILKDHQTKLEEARRLADELGKTLETEKKQLMGSFSRQTEISNQVHGLEAKVDALSVRINQLTSRINEKEYLVQDLTEKELSTRTQYQELKEKCDVLKLQVETLRTRIQDLDENLRNYKVQEQELRKKRMTAETRKQALQQLVDSGEGLHADVKNILKNPEFKDHISGIFSDFLEAHPGFEYAIEAVLKDFLETLVMKDKGQGMALLSKLKEENLGRANLWLVDVLQSQSALTKTFSQPAGSKKLVDVLRMSHENADLFSSLFAGYFVFDTIDEALNAFSSSYETGMVLVTREGDLIDSFGRLSGGSTKSLQSGVLARKNELAQLTEQLVTLVAEHDNVTQLVQTTEEELRECRTQFETQSLELRDIEVQTKSAEKDWTSTAAQLDVNRKAYEEESEEKRQCEEDRQTHWASLDGIREELGRIEANAREMQEGIEGKTLDFNRAMEKCAELQGELIQLKVEFTSSQEKYKYSIEKSATLERDVKVHRSRLEDINRIINHKLDEKDVLHEELYTLEETLTQSVDQAQNLEQMFRSCKDEVEQSRHKLREVLEDQKQAMKAVEESTSALNRIRLDLDKSMLEFQSVLQNLFEKYAFEESSIVHDPEFDKITAEEEKEMLEEVESLRDKMRRLGEVNLSAVEEYDEQKKRYDFLTTQRQDLLRSISDLEKAIERINKTSQERFARAYEEINKRFTQIFPLVFGGGSARLELTNPEDINETGVEIIAEPPGKKMGSIQLMSGGEKALTAVALIFSIFLIKPSPFCVLDEVDAPLDDHNVGKFNMLLKEMAQRSQFIIITHNKRTMELNNKLYGVTMEEPGVSKMVSIEVH